MFKRVKKVVKMSNFAWFSIKSCLLKRLIMKHKICCLILCFMTNRFNKHNDFIENQAKLDIFGQLFWHALNANFYNKWDSPNQFSYNRQRMTLSFGLILCTTMQKPVVPRGLKNTKIYVFAWCCSYKKIGKWTSMK